MPQQETPQRLQASGVMTDFQGVDMPQATRCSALRTGATTDALPTHRQAVDVISSLGPVIYALRRGGTIKIGWTSNLAQRVHSLGGWRLIGFMLDGTRAKETEIHRRLAGHAHSGREWYPHDDPAVLEVLDEMRDQMALSLS
jgi:hypothetical protein